ncbi:MAG: hypothetical protein GY820_39545 [Gammaproteobacteria bacterium]|nr:hypothetical protein [Gammaproteobacteria bacterium]
MSAGLRVRTRRHPAREFPAQGDHLCLRGDVEDPAASLAGLRGRVHPQGEAETEETWEAQPYSAGVARARREGECSNGSGEVRQGRRGKVSGHLRPDADPLARALPAPSRRSSLAVGTVPADNTEEATDARD